MATITPTPLDKIIARMRLPWHWFVIFTGTILIAIPFLVAYLDGFMDEFLYEGVWRNLLIAPVIVFYIIALQYPMGKSQKHAIDAFRPIVQIEDDTFNLLVRESSDVDDRAELIAFIVGAVLGIIANAPWNVEGNYPLLRIYFPLSGALMYGFLSWIIVSSLGSTKLLANLHQQPMKIDIFDLRPFEPIGRQSLMVSLAFIGGSVISMLIINPLEGNIEIGVIAIYVILALVTLLVFFLGMRHTHRVLAEAKDRELREIRGNIADVLRSLAVHKAEGGNFGEVSTELNLWLKYEEQVKGTRTWPYNTAMLRTLFLSVFVPALTSIAQRLLSSLFS